MNESPFHTMQTAAVGLHELLRSYVEAGFTRQEAFELCRTIMHATISNQTQCPPPRL